MIKLADGKERSIQYIATTTYWGPDGRPMSAQQFLERLFGDLSSLILDEDQLRKQWSDPDQRERFVALLQQRGYDSDKLDGMRRLIDAPDSDLYDVLSYIRFSNPPKTRTERADSVEAVGLAATEGEMRDFLIGVLKAYRNNGESELGRNKLSAFLTARYGTIADAKAKLGDIAAIRVAFFDVQRELYAQ